MTIDFITIFILIDFGPNVANIFVIYTVEYSP